MKEINLNVFGIIVSLTGDGGGAITSTLKEDFDTVEGVAWNCAMDAIESMVLAHAVAGVDIESPSYLEGIETAVQSCGENIEFED